MPLVKVKVQKLKPSAKNQVFAGRTSTSVASQVADILELPLIRAAASVLLLIFETVDHLQRNKAGCTRLAQRAADILLDVREHMHGRWHRAPYSLVKNLAKLESTLVLIYEFMKREVEAHWRHRLLRKGQIEDAVETYNILLDDAARSFQISALIDIHYTLHKAVSDPGVPRGDALRLPSMRSESTMIEVLNPKTRDEVDMVIDLYSETNTQRAALPVLIKEPDEIEDVVPDLSLLAEVDDCGFPRYHGSQLTFSERRTSTGEGWWADTSEVVVNGETAIMKRYDGPDGPKNWLRDVKMLQNVYHPNLPQLIGLSDASTPIPFVLLTGAQTRTPEAFMLEALRNASLAFCAELILRLYRDVSEAALYTQEEMSYSDAETQDFLEAASYRLDSEHSLVVGLPPPKDGKWTTVRNYGLAYSLLKVALKMLPNCAYDMHLHRQEDPEMPLALQRKYSHLAVLARSLLPPERGKSPALPAAAAALLADDSFDGSRPTLALSAVRAAARAEHAWCETQDVPPHKFAVGDLGHVPHGAKLGESFVKLCNVFELEHGQSVPAATFPVEKKQRADMWCWKDRFNDREDVQGFPMGPDIFGWPVAVNPTQEMDVQVLHAVRAAVLADAWAFLTEHGKALGARFGVPADELVLITNAGTSQNFSIQNRSAPPHAHILAHGQRLGYLQRQPLGHAHHQPFGHAPFGGFAGGGAGFPRVFYLHTSPDEGVLPYWAKQPAYFPGGNPEPQLDPGVHLRYGWKHGFVWYIMGYSEDFE